MFKVENFNHYFIITETKEEVTRQPQCTVKTIFSPTEMNKNAETKFFKLSQKNVCWDKHGKTKSKQTSLAIARYCRVYFSNKKICILRLGGRLIIFSLILSKEKWNLQKLMFFCIGSFLYVWNQIFGVLFSKVSNCYTAVFSITDILCWIFCYRIFKAVLQFVNWM